MLLQLKGQGAAEREAAEVDAQTSEARARTAPHTHSRAQPRRASLARALARLLAHGRVRASR
jgi:hypothetical protein